MTLNDVRISNVTSGVTLAESKSLVTVYSKKITNVTLDVNQLIKPGTETEFLISFTNGNTISGEVIFS